MRWAFSAALAAAFIIAGLAMAGSISAAPEDKVTICHAAGLEGTTHFLELTLAPGAAETHVDLETGTPQAGHEQDFLGPCSQPPPPPEECPEGTTGTPPDCVTPPPEECPEGTVGTPPDCVSEEFCDLNPQDPACNPPPPPGGNGGTTTTETGPPIYGGPIVTGPFPNPGGIFVPPPVQQVAGVQQVAPAALPAAGFGPGSDGSSLNFGLVLAAIALLSLGGATAVAARNRS